MEKSQKDPVKSIGDMLENSMEAEIADTEFTQKIHISSTAFPYSKSSRVRKTGQILGKRYETAK